MRTYEQIQSAAEHVQKTAGSSYQQPKVGVVLGSGLGAFARCVSSHTVIPYREIPEFPQSSVTGHKGELLLGSIENIPVAVMSGRVHFYEGYSMDRVTFPVRVLAALGADVLLVTNAAGGANPTYAPGDFMIITDHINLTGQNPLIGHNDDRMGPRFPDMTEAYSVRGRDVLRRAAKAVGVSVHEGVYAGLSGPSYETPAEIRMLQKIGADAVGMSTVSEVIVARHAGMEVVGMSVITNRAAGLSEEPLSHEEVKEVGARVEGVFCDLLVKAVTLIQ